MKKIDKKRWQEHRSANFLFEAARVLNLKPEWLTDYGLFSIVVSDRKRHVFYSQTGLNSQLAAYLTKNKHICRILLEKNGFSNIPYCLPESKSDVEQFFRLHKKIVIKPTMGQRSEGVILIENISQIKDVEYEECILEKFITGEEMRYLFLNGKVIAVQQRNNKPTSDIAWNKERHSVEKLNWDKTLMETTLKVADVFELKFGTVDFIVDKLDKGLVLEVNCAPALWPFHTPVSGPKVDVSKMLLESMIKS